mmetsp:Transcript_33030/g.77220  ORF Transcript_33030/g.77220 Transcript_33030/m.77220 type:complete len:276 (+) Transcript_33030:46-873(+)
MVVAAATEVEQNGVADAKEELEHEMTRLPSGCEDDVEVPKCQAEKSIHALPEKLRSMTRVQRVAYLACQAHKEQGCRSYPVWLHVYDLGPLSRHIMNKWRDPTGGLGLFHCGVEVLGVEWCFRAVSKSTDEGTTGLSCHVPKAHPHHLYLRSENLGHSTLALEEIQSLIINLERVWTANKYHYILNNCTDFAEHLSDSLGVTQPFPTWVHGAAKRVLKHTPLATTSSQLKWLASCGSSSESCGSSEGSVDDVSFFQSMLGQKDRGGGTASKTVST